MVRSAPCDPVPLLVLSIIPSGIAACPREVSSARARSSSSGSIIAFLHGFAGIQGHWSIDHGFAGPTNNWSPQVTATCRPRVVPWADGLRISMYEAMAIRVPVIEDEPNTAGRLAAAGP